MRHSARALARLRVLAALSIGLVDQVAEQLEPLRLRPRLARIQEGNVGQVCPALRHEVGLLTALR